MNKWIAGQNKVAIRTGFQENSRRGTHLGIPVAKSRHYDDQGPSSG